MKQLTEYNRVAGYLNKIFSLLNETYFENALSKPVITIQSTPRAYGHVSCAKVWTSDEEHRHELNIGAGTLRRNIENVVATMLHEMVHLWNIQNGVQDCSRGGAYHNKRFKEEAEKRDLIIEHHASYGWTLTTPSDALIEWCIKNDLAEIRVTRHDGAFSFTPPAGGKAGTHAPPTATGKKPSSTRKYICPHCSASVRATRDISIICGACFDPATPEKIPYMIKQG